MFRTAVLVMLLLAVSLLPAQAQGDTAACSARTAAASGISSEALESGGLTRIYTRYVPTNYDPTVPVPLVLSLHGAVSTADEQQEKTGWDAVAERETFIAVYPQGILPLATGFRWNAGEPMTSPLFALVGAQHEVDDVAFIDDLLDHLISTLCIDTARIFVTGFSNGGGMTNHLACVLADRIAAIGTNAGAYTAIPGGCEPSRPMPVITFQGVHDQVVPYDGHADLGLQAVQPWAADWAARNGCDPDPIALDTPAQTVEAIQYVDCADDASVDVYTILDGGHTWPGGGWKMPLVLGHTNTDISATETMWAFFTAHPMPAQMVEQ